MKHVLVSHYNSGEYEVSIDRKVNREMVCHTYRNVTNKSIDRLDAILNDGESNLTVEVMFINFHRYPDISYRVY